MLANCVVLVVAKLIEVQQYLVLQGGVVLVSHDQHLIKLCMTEVWLTEGKTVRRLDGGLEQYRTAVENEFRTN